MIKVTVKWEIEPLDEAQTLVIDTGLTKEEWDDMKDSEQIDFLEYAVRETVADAVRNNEISFPWYKEKIEEDEG